MDIYTDTCIEISKEFAMDNEIATLDHHRFELYLSGCSLTEQNLMQALQKGLSLAATGTH